jgi:hypothetical protein
MVSMLANEVLTNQSLPTKSRDDQGTNRGRRNARPESTVAATCGNHFGRRMAAPLDFVTVGIS